MITYQRQDNEIILQMPVEDWERLLWLVDSAALAAKARGDRQQFWLAVRFGNDLNRTNPAYTPYEIPEAFR